MAVDPVASIDRWQVSSRPLVTLPSSASRTSSSAEFTRQADQERRAIGVVAEPVTRIGQARLLDAGQGAAEAVGGAGRDGCGQGLGRDAGRLDLAEGREVVVADGRRRLATGRAAPWWRRSARSRQAVWSSDSA